jgi:hypothetical protein
MFVIVIGRGSGGTRLMSEALSTSGIHMGPVNVSGDLVPAEEMYKAVRLASGKVRLARPEEWNFTELLNSVPPPEFKALVLSYLAPVLRTPREHTGWKLPETALAFPWIVKMFPDAHYIHWTRDPRGATASPHLTDDMARFGVPSRFAPVTLGPESLERRMERRFESWAYHRQIVDVTPAPAKFLTVRYEDFVLHQARELDRLEGFLGVRLNEVAVDPKQLGIEGRVVPPHLLERYGYAPRSA